jgi:eukaryotic-like serine/threonine-protein kinase
VAEAIAIWEKALPESRRVAGPEHPNTLSLMNRFATAQETLGRWAGAEVIRREVVALRRGSTPAGSPLLAGDLDGLARNLLVQARAREAELLLRESLPIREKALSKDWTRFNTMSLLGGAHLRQGRYAEAELLLIQGYERMKACEAKIPAPGKPRLPEAAERVIRLYEAWGKPEKAAAWKEKLGLADLPTEVFARP